MRASAPSPGIGTALVPLRRWLPYDLRETPLSEALAHLFGDYVAQSDWMAAEKTSRHLPAALHAASYAACFLPVTRSVRALAVIGGTHFVIDRWRLARYVVWAKNQAAPARHRYPLSHAGWHGYHGIPGRTLHHSPEYAAAAGIEPNRCEAPDKPDWLAGWLLIIADNACHLAVNRRAIRRFRKPPAP